MGAVNRVLTSAALALTPLAAAPPAPAGATPLAVGTPLAAGTQQSPTCHYVNETDEAAPVRMGPGKQFGKKGELAPSKEPVRATCAAIGRGREHWVRLKSGEHKGLWVWRDRLQPWSG
ncbi:hypothetical protein [Nonomuraea sp. KM90]|uniref:hypothetical protein n=1 Tax=Nonomuraea sp. KM90 TaxID=3457428 RepID=UPI003FCDCF4D